MIAEVRANTNPLEADLDDGAFRRLAENLPTLCWIAEADGYIRWYNKRWYEYTGKTPAEMKGWGWQSVHDPRRLGEVLDRWKVAISSGRPFEMIIHIRGADGISRPFLTRINPAFDDQGRVSNWFGVNTDVSMQIEAEDALAQSEARFRVIADSMPQMVWSASADGRHDYFNARWYEFTGAPVGSTDGDHWMSLLHPDDRTRVANQWRQVLAADEPYHTEHRLRCRTGEYRWVLARAHAERNAQGGVTRWFGAYTDIEDLVVARAVLQRSRDDLEREVAARTGERNLLATLVDTTDLMVMAIDSAHNILAINKSNIDEFEKVYGVRPTVGDNLLVLLADRPALQARMREGWRGGLAGEDVTFTDVRGDPSRAQGHYEIKVRPLRDPSGRVIGAFQFAQDITARVRDQAMLAQAQEALLQARKLEGMGQLTGGVAHDFNNLLTPILGSLDMLRRRGIGSARERTLIDGAYQSAQRARVLVHRLLAFARRQPLKTAPTDMGALLKGMADLLNGAMGPQVEMTLAIPGAAPWATADSHQLELAVLNLCVNARDAMDGRGRLTLEISAEAIDPGSPLPLPPGRYARLRVADTGKGMDEETLARAIEPFFSTKGIGKGTGLGLSMAHGLALQLGGALTLQSAPGVGTEVSIWLPECAAPGSGQVGAKDRQVRPRADLLALLVDDEAAIRASTAEMLGELGFRVHECPSAEAALLALGDGLAPDVVITDHLMAGMTGTELARAMGGRWPTLKILLVSGYAEADTLDPGLPYLIKPFVQTDLVQAIIDLGLPLSEGGDDRGRKGSA